MRPRTCVNTCDPGGIDLLRHGAGRILCIGTNTEAHNRPIRFLKALKEPRELCRPSQTQKYHPGGIRIKGAGVSHSSLSREPSHGVDDVMRGHTDLFINI